MLFHDLYITPENLEFPGSEILTAEYRERSAEKLIQEVRSYDDPWTDVDEENLDEDEKFLYLEVEASEDIAGEFHELGRSYQLIPLM